MVELVNVLHLRSSVVVGGVETSLVGWMRHADSLGVHARLFCFEQGDGAEQPFLDYLKRRGLRAELVPWGRHRRFFAALKVLHSAIRHAWPCVVHTHDHRSDVIGWIAARRAGAPVVASASALGASSAV